MLAYLTILTTSICGLALAPWWTVISAGCLLALISLTEQRRSTGFAGRGLSGTYPNISGIMSLFNGLAAAAAAYILGRGSGWLWGF